MTAREFLLWLRYSKPGDKLIYHKGCLARARGEGRVDVSSLEAKMRELGDAAYKAHQDGVVTLVQKRNGPLDYDYIALAKAFTPRRTPAPTLRRRVNHWRETAELATAM